MSADANKTYSSRFVSTFLSHQYNDKEKWVVPVAEQLVRRGVVTWLDKHELNLGSLDRSLRDAIARIPTFTLFLSEGSVKSQWCNDELKSATDSKKDNNTLFPIYLGDPLSLVQSHDFLSSRFLHADGDRVNQLGCVVKPGAKFEPDEIAKKIARSVYDQVIPNRWNDVVIWLDQRGNGERRGTPDLPDNICALNAPTLVFQPGLSPRTSKETLFGDAWEHVVNTLENALSEALGVVRGEPRNVRVLGHAQTGLFWAVGKHFDRTTSANLFGYPQNGAAVSNKGQERTRPLEGGDAKRATLVARATSGAPTKPDVIALGVGPRGYEAQVISEVGNIPLFWIDPVKISDSEQAMQLVKDIVAFVSHQRANAGIRELMMFWASAAHVAPLAAANLTTHVIERIRYMEWDHQSSQYFHLPMP